jgi:VWFA-related protein
VSAGVLAAQQSPAPRFETGVDLLQLDVSVLDKKRAPVSDLTPRDFTVDIDGKSVPIVAFTLVRLDSPASRVLPGPPDVGPDVLGNDSPTEGRLIVFHFDQNVLPWEMVEGRKIVREAIAAFDPADRAAITYNGLATPQNFTSDRQLLLTTLEQPFTDDDDNQGRCLCGVCQVDAVTRIAESLEAVGRQPKILFYIGVGLPFQAVPRIGDQYDCSGPLKLARERLFRVIDRSGLVVHAIDPSGLLRVRRSPGSRVAGAGVGPKVSQLIYNPSLLPDRTGGRWIRNTNDPHLFSRPILSESQSYYVLGIERPVPRPDGRDRSVSVRVRRSDVTVVSRRLVATGPPSSGPSKPEVPAHGEPSATLVTALAGITPVSGLRMAVNAAAFRSDGPKANSTVLVVTSLQAAAPSPSGESLRVLAGSWDRNGMPVVMHMQTVAPPTAEAVSFEVASALSLHRGRHEIRVAAEGTVSTARGSVYTYVDVPDFAKDKLSLSGLLAGAAPAPLFASVDLFKELLPIIPTALREFTRMSRVAVFVRAYQGGDDPPRDVAMTATLLGLSQTPIHRETTTLTAARFTGTRSTDYLTEVPVAQLAPGPYLLTLEAALDDKRITRHMRFEMK